MKNEHMLPPSVREKTNLAYEEIRFMSRKQKNKRKKRLSLVAASILVVGAISMQPPVLAEIKQLLFGGYYKGLQSALEQGALQPIEGVSSEDQGIKLELIGAVVDATVIQLRLKLTTEDPSLLKNFRYTQHSPRFVDQFTLTATEGHLLQGVDKEGTYIPPVQLSPTESVRFISSSTEEVYTYRLPEGELYMDLLFNSSTGEYTRLKGLTLTLDELLGQKGSWTLPFIFADHLPEMTQTAYTVSTPHEHIEVQKATAYQTGLTLDFIIKTPVDESIISNTSLLTADGSVYTSGRTGWMESTPSGERVVLTFEVLPEELGDSFTLLIKNGEDKDLSILLKKF